MNAFSPSKSLTESESSSSLKPLSSRFSIVTLTSTSSSSRGWVSALKGGVEQLAPIFKVFGYNPSDARFIGDPVDYVIFDGYTKVRERIEDIPITIVLADVKTGDADLTYEQRRIKQGVEKGLVKFEVIRL